MAFPFDVNRAHAVTLPRWFQGSGAARDYREDDPFTGEVGEGARPVHGYRVTALEERRERLLPGRAGVGCIDSIVSV